MTLADVRVAFAHWWSPLATPLVALTAGAAAADSTGFFIPVNIWVEVVQLLVVLLVMRTVIFFEFREHERKERRLYDGVVKTGRSFDEIWAEIRDRQKKLDEWHREAEIEIEDHADQLEKHDRRLDVLESHPLLRRAGG